MGYDLIIKNGTIVTARSTYDADIAIIGERIAAIGHGLTGGTVLDASGKMVTPGAVDIHVHLEMPIGKYVSADSFYTGTVAAAHGGTTSIIDFVERGPGESMVEAIAARRSKANQSAVIDYGLHMTLGPSEIGILDQVPEAFQAGCISFKLYMAYGLRLTDSQMLWALEAIAAVKGLPVVHAENWDIICDLVSRNLASGRTQPKWHPHSRPAIMEGEAVGRVIDIATMVGTPLHIFHVTSPQAVHRIARARRDGKEVTGETCPQYLLLDQTIFEQPGVEGALPVCSPPIRDAMARELLWTALGQGDLQLITTDHCPFTKQEKSTGLHDYSQIPGGVPSIEMRFPAIYHFGVRRRKLSLNQWVELCCTAPARLVGLAGKGDIAVGFDADLVIFDPDKEMTLSQKSLHENVDWTPYQGFKINGWPETTISRGEIIVNHGEFHGEPGRGKFAKRSFSLYEDQVGVLANDKD